MKTLNGNRYFEAPDILDVMNSLLTELTKKDFMRRQTSSDIVLVQNAIKKFSANLLIALKTEFAVNFEFIETTYTDLMHPADSLLDPLLYNQLAYADITSVDMAKVEHWFFNYGISLLVAEFEKI
jgi:hypothetical protein